MSSPILSLVDSGRYLGMMRHSWHDFGDDSLFAKHLHHQDAVSEQSSIEIKHNRIATYLLGSETTHTVASLHRMLQSMFCARFTMV
jgi:hypothetical protein